MADWSRNLLAMLMGVQQGQQQKQAGQAEQFQQMLQNQLQQQQLGLQGQQAATQRGYLGLAEQRFAGEQEATQRKSQEALERIRADREFSGALSGLIGSADWGQMPIDDKVNALLGVAVKSGNASKRLADIEAIAGLLPKDRAGEPRINTYVKSQYGILNTVTGEIERWEELGIDPTKMPRAELIDRLVRTKNMSVFEAQGIANPIYPMPTLRGMPTGPSMSVPPPAASFPPAQELTPERRKELDALAAQIIGAVGQDADANLEQTLAEREKLEEILERSPFTGEEIKEKEKKRKEFLRQSYRSNPLSGGMQP